MGDFEAFVEELLWVALDVLCQQNPAWGKPGAAGSELGSIDSKSCRCSWWAPSDHRIHASMWHNRYDLWGEVV
ncbi:hypothetical protein Droror1_Dr00027154 [Drosera rotundifolia]